MRAASFCLANSLQLSKLQKDLLVQGRKTVIQSDVLHERLNGGDIFYFKNGTVVTWNLSKLENKNTIQNLGAYCVEPNSVMDHDEFVVEIGASRTYMEPQGYFNVDLIHIESDMDSTEMRLALSYPLSQSSKLQYFERKIEEFTQQYSPLIEALAKHGKVSRSSKAISKIIGQLFIVKSQVNLTSTYLNPPHFFWQNVNFESTYAMVRSYMDVPDRVESINQKMDVLNEMLNMLNSQLHHQHGSFLEIIIIVLLCVEILLGFLPFILY